MSKVPFYKPHLPKSTYPALKQVLDSGWITTGPKVKEFEEDFGDFIGSKYNTAVSSCTAALHLAYLAHDLGPKDEVIVPSFTFCSVINAIVHTGATPVFCDIDERTMCIDPQDVVRRITKKTKAVVVVHYAGMPADMDKINKIAQKHNLIVIEDAAHAFMTVYKGKMVGSGDNTTCFSFYATKNLTTSEGGMVTTKNKKLHEYFQIMRMHGISKHAWKRYGNKGSWQYDVKLPGYKYNMTDIEAVIGLEQLRVANKSAKRREKLAKKYKSLLKDNNNIQLPMDVPYPNSRHAWHIFTIRVKDSCNLSRDELIEKLKESGIGTSVHFIPNHLQSYYKKSLKNKVRLPITERVFNSILTLPFYEDLTDKQVRYVCDKINELTKQ